jgi:hypothetical protein
MFTDTRSWRLWDRQEGDVSWNAFDAARRAYRIRLAELAAEQRAARLLGNREDAAEAEGTGSG